MLRIMTMFVVLALLIATPARQAAAQNNTLGGAIVGAAAGAILGSQLEPRRGGYYWYHGRCYRLHRDGNYYPTRRDYCY
jgi:hypothetical protein